MIKAESKGAERTLRSASPHRNAYKSDFHSIKCSFDGTQSEATSKNVTNGSSDTREESRGRPFGTRVNKIKNIFLQMDGQQQESQEGKQTLKPDVPLTSPTKTQFPVSAHRVSFNSASSPESHNLDKMPKGEDVEIDKVALAEKFSVTRKLFERGIKEQTVTEKQSPNRVVNRLSIGSASDEGKSTRRVSGGTETAGKIEQTHVSTVKSHSDEMADGEKRHVPRVSLNAGPISKRLENYMVENDTEDNHTFAGKEGMVSTKQHSTAQHIQPTSPTRDSLHKSTSPVKEAADSVNNVTNRNKDSKPASLGSSFGTKPIGTSPENKSVSLTADNTHKLHSPEETASVNHGYKLSSSSVDRFGRTSVGGDEAKPRSPPQRHEKQSLISTGGSQHADKAKSKDDMTLGSTGEKPPSQTSFPESKVGSMVRAELVVVQNESSESEGNEEESVEDSVFEEQKHYRELKRSFTADDPSSNAVLQRGTDTVDEGRVLEDDYDFFVKEEKEKDSSLLSQDGEEDEATEEDATLEKQVDRASPAVYGIENAAFVDDREVDQAIGEEEEEEVEGDEEDQTYGEYDDCYETPGLSDEDEPPPKRKIKFSTDPILVSA